MKKILLTIGCLFIFTTVTFAQAPELKNMMPNSWEKLTRLSEQEEKEFLKQQQVITDIENVKSDSWASSKYIINEKRVYKETANNVEFYRVLTCNYDMSEFLNAEYKDTTVTNENYDKYIHQRIQQTIYAKQKSKELTKIRTLEYKVYGVAEGNMETDGCEYFEFYDFFIKELNKNEIGFFITEASIGYQITRKDNMIICDYSKTKNQMSGANMCEFLCVKNKEDFVKAFSDNKRRVRINASDYLFDSKCPLKYSIQNAFDGNPATSYVENTEDDLFILDIGTGGKDVTKLAIINGYAQNEKLYIENNRIKKIGKNKILTDNQLTYQILPCLGSYLTITDLYNGVKYNDTCVAEVNLEINGKWLYGDLDE